VLAVVPTFFINPHTLFSKDYVTLEAIGAGGDEDKRSGRKKIVSLCVF